MLRCVWLVPIILSSSLSSSFSSSLSDHVIIIIVNYLTLLTLDILLTADILLLVSPLRLSLHCGTCCCVIIVTLLLLPVSPLSQRMCPLTTFLASTDSSIACDCIYLDAAPCHDARDAHVGHAAVSDSDSQRTRARHSPSLSAVISKNHAR